MIHHHLISHKLILSIKLKNVVIHRNYGSIILAHRKDPIDMNYDPAA
jgi:hypothetical protein